MVFRVLLFPCHALFSAKADSFRVIAMDAFPDCRAVASQFPVCGNDFDPSVYALFRGEIIGGNLDDELLCRGILCPKSICLKPAWTKPISLRPVWPKLYIDNPPAVIFLLAYFLHFMRNGSFLMEKPKHLVNLFLHMSFIPPLGNVNILPESPGCLSCGAAPGCSAQAYPFCCRQNPT